MDIFKETIKAALKQYWASFAFGITGLALTFDSANFVVIMQGIGVVSLILFFMSLVLDDKDGKGLFPSYCEGDLINVCKTNPIASAIVVATKNILIIVITILAYLFIKP